MIYTFRKNKKCLLKENESIVAHGIVYIATSIVSLAIFNVLKVVSLASNPRKAIIFMKGAIINLK